ncbi:unnamed protein product [Haemonchus placei]|uniref:Transposase n=1 Tax=Haemonchus placei TaxID=6290 RepID=A0A0N4WHC8_HAEPC|nr:unnamed protein product [Haemonchus placei]
MVTGCRMLIYDRQYLISGVPLCQMGCARRCEESEKRLVRRVCRLGELAEANVAVDHVVIVLPPPLRGK